MCSTTKQNFCIVLYLQIFAPGAALWWFKTYQNHLPSFLSWQNWTWLVKFKKPSKTAVVLNSGVPHLGHFLPPAPHRTIRCLSTSGPRDPGLSNPTYFLRPALPIAPTTNNNAKDERSVLRPNPATFFRDFTLYMTTEYAFVRTRCLNYISRSTHIVQASYI